MKHIPIIIGNQSPADDLFDMGESLTRWRRCGCLNCTLNLKHVADRYREEIVELAEAWYALSHKQTGTVFQGLVEGWSEAKCAKACGLTYNFEREAA